jgi:hypothetical protein
MAPEELASVQSMPGSFEEALDNLEADHASHDSAAGTAAIFSLTLSEGLV